MCDAMPRRARLAGGATAVVDLLPIGVKILLVLPDQKAYLRTFASEAASSAAIARTSSGVGLSQRSPRDLNP